MSSSDYVNDPTEEDALDTWDGIEGLIDEGVENIFGPGTEEFLREAEKRQTYMKSEIMRRYDLGNG